MCRHPTILRRLSSGAMRGIAAFFSQEQEKKKEELVCSPNHNKQKSASDIYHDSNSHHDHDTIFANPIILFGFGAFLYALAGVSFYAGCFIHILMISNNSNSISQRTSSFEQNLSFSVATDLFDASKQLPPPTVIPGKEVPPTTYTFKHFPVEGSRTSYDLHLSRVALDDYENSEDSSDDSSDDDEQTKDLTEGLHLPAGQHLLVDIKNVDPIFLNSEVRLAEAMIELVDESKLTMLSYHCQ